MGSPPHVAVVAFPFSSYAPKLLAVARALATAAPSATFSFLSTAASLDRLRASAAILGNLRFVEVSTGFGEDDDDDTPPWRRMELFVNAAEAGGLKQSLEAASAAAPGAAKVSCVVGDAFMSMAADAGVTWVAVWTGGPCALLAHLRGDALREDIGDQGMYDPSRRRRRELSMDAFLPASRGDELLTSHRGLGSFRVRDLPFGGANASGDMHSVMDTLLKRMAQRLPVAATAVALNAFPGLFPPEISAALADALPNSLAIGPYHLLLGAAAPAAGDPHGCLAWLDRQPQRRSVVYVSFGTVAAPPPDELRELAAGLEATGAPFLWSLRRESWPLLSPGFMAAAKGGLVVPWAPQAAVLRHAAVGAFVAHSGWGSVAEGMAGGVPMACRPFFGDQRMNARAVEELWGFGVSFEGGRRPVARGSVAEVVAALLAAGGEEGDRARELRAKVDEAFLPDRGSMNNFRKFLTRVLVVEPAHPSSSHRLGTGVCGDFVSLEISRLTASNKIVHRDEITEDAFTDSAQIPEKYIRTDEVSAGAVVGEDEAYELPVIDMARLLDPELSASETAKLGSACRDWVDEAVIQRMKDSTVQFFGLPVGSKNAVAVRADGFEGYGHHYSRMSKLDWAESVILITQPEYSAEVTKLMRQLLVSMAADLGVDAEALTGAFEGKRQSMAIHHYPPCQHPEKVIGNTAHTDGLGLTVLLHVDDTPGLQMLRGGRWFPVRPAAGALVVNVGDILHILTNGAYRSVEHRVVVGADRGRTTAVVFQDASVGGMVAPLPELLVANGGGEKARYRSIPRFEYLKVRFSALAKRKGFLDSLKL
ncbi:hypothetical protein HU200_027060 [Digitaria exilis]|uniref:Fe2OG dioxygenase domain-containing protein n=1 Tax=Digitaria exilis TaxID=1010633 RepID=A0A835BY65_9POAL|nr:hypothetical protein HU200_027060 [Digitaria exilis]